MNVDPSFLSDLDQAQRIGREVLEAVFGALQPGMGRAEIEALLREEVARRGAEMGDPPHIELGEESAGGVLSLALRKAPLGSGEVVCLALRPVIGQAVGHVADTQVIGENGRAWQYRRMAYRIYQTFLDALPGCRTERDVIRLADDCAYHRGFTLFHPITGSIAHPIVPTDAEQERREHRKRLVTNRLRRLVPGGDRPFEGPWSVEPRYLVGEIGFHFTSVVMKDDDGLRVLGGPLPAGVPTGPWLA